MDWIQVAQDLDRGWCCRGIEFSDSVKEGKFIV
jgi:hypothetical protein